MVSTLLPLTAHRWLQVGASNVVGFLLRRAENVSHAMAILSECTVVEDPVVQEVIKGGHWALADAHGNSAVVAYLDGKLHHWDNEVGVLTNDPPFDWHLSNLNR